MSRSCASATSLHSPERSGKAMRPLTACRAQPASAYGSSGARPRRPGRRSRGSRRGGRRGRRRAASARGCRALQDDRRVGRAATGARYRGSTSSPTIRLASPAASMSATEWVAITRPPRRTVTRSGRARRSRRGGARRRARSCPRSGPPGPSRSRSTLVVRKDRRHSRRARALHRRPATPAAPRRSRRPSAPPGVAAASGRWMSRSTPKRASTRRVSCSCSLQRTRPIAPRGWGRRAARGCPWR